jgi:CHASE2 domain-containing sensor protein
MLARFMLALAVIFVVLVVGVVLANVRSPRSQIAFLIVLTLIGLFIFAWYVLAHFGQNFGD